MIFEREEEEAEEEEEEKKKKKKKKVEEEEKEGEKKKKMMTIYTCIYPITIIHMYMSFVCLPLLAQWATEERRQLRRAPLSIRAIISDSKLTLF